MIFSHVVLLLGALSPVLSTLHYPPASVKLHEARARLLAHRARVKEYSQRLANRLRTPIPPQPSRVKRHQYLASHPEEFAQDLGRFYPTQQTKYGYGKALEEEQQQQPAFVHIYPVEDDVVYERSERNRNEDFHGFPGIATNPRTNVDPREEEKTSDFLEQNAEERETQDGARDGNRLEQNLTNEFEQKNVNQRPNPKSLKMTEGPDAEAFMQRMRNNFEARGDLNGNREADAHLHSHSSAFTFQKVKTHGGFLVPQTVVAPQTHLVGPSVHLPEGHAVTSGVLPPQIQHTTSVNLNINRGIYSDLHKQGVSPTTHGTHTEAVFYSRNSGEEHLGQELEPNPHSFRQPSRVLPEPLKLENESERTEVNIHSKNDPDFDQFQNDEEKNVRSEDEVMDLDLSGLNREAQPTIKKLKELLKDKLHQPYPTYYTYLPIHGNQNGYYREAGNDAEAAANSEDIREADPTLKKLLQLQKQYSLPPSFYNANSQPYGGYGRAEEDTAAREATPTIKKLKEKLMPKYQPYPSYSIYSQHYGKHTGPYRQTDTDDSEFLEDYFPENGNSRSAKPQPTIKLLKKLKEKLEYPPPYPEYNMNPHFYDQNFDTYREAEDNVESRQREDVFDDKMSSHFLFNVPGRRVSDQYKRSIDEALDSVLGTERDIVDSLREKSKNDEDLKLVFDISNRTLTDIEERRKNVTKRSLPLTRLISDPNVKLDVPKTLENFGTTTKGIFEDERAPLYHVNNLVGSTKSSLLSAMKIPPQNMIVPSDYAIVKTSDRDEATTSGPFGHTIKRVGEIVRDSVRSTYDTASHLGDIAHSARNVLHSARHSVPRLMIPYSQVPAVRVAHRKMLDEAALRALRRQNAAEDSKSNLIRLGHLMDAVGISKPTAKNLNLPKIIWEPRRPSEIPASARTIQLYNKIRNKNNNDVGTVSDAISALEDAKVSVGARNLRELLVKMKNELTHTEESFPDKHRKKKYQSKTTKQQETKEIGKFIENLFDGSTAENQKTRTEDSGDEVVGDRIFLSPELLHPFMGIPSKTEIKKFLLDVGNEVQDEKKTQRDSDLGYVLGAINPVVFERLNNETVTVRNNQFPDPEGLFREQTQDRENVPVGKSFLLEGRMSNPSADEIPQQELFNAYNKDMNTENFGKED